ncbi:PQQ-binding-like beta-propeller repeat protein [Natronosalvus caseinilyticus]|uniref:outer membrane protein assembly factor BamB family protein n=1 Tax=Natronosalvus caseinilyticus TaxID=2953747 RepID=UPI0028B26578|nr:PQQ-binding-like beta-propeller repeat protein [Natronosalvus caseinilyticus]
MDRRHTSLRTHRREFLAACGVGAATIAGCSRLRADSKPNVAWTVDGSNVPYSWPVLVDGTLYVGTRGGQLKAIDTETGSVSWSAYIAEDLFVTPAVDDSRIYVGYHDFSAFATDGTESWTTTLEWGSLVHGPNPSVLVDDSVIVGTRNGYLYSLATDDGTVEWETQMGERRPTPYAVIDDGVLVGDESGTIAAIDPADASVRWERTVSVDPERSGDPYLTVNGDAAYVSGTSIQRLDLETGDSVWTVDDADRTFTSPAPANDTVYVTGSDLAAEKNEDLSRPGYICALDAETGDQRWREPLESSAYRPAARDDGRVYVGDVSEQFYSFDADGSERWTVSVDGNVVNRPALEGDRIYFGTGQGTTYALEES